MPNYDELMKLEGWCPLEKMKRLYDLVKSINAKTVVELGVYGGKSLIPMAIAIKELNNFGNCYAVDPWEAEASIDNYDPSHNNYIWWNNLDHKSIYDKFIEGVKKHDVSEHVITLKYKSMDIIGRFSDESIDVLHQDANHSEKSSCEEVENFYNKVKLNGYWVMDDTKWETTKKAQMIILEKGYILLEEHENWKIFQRVTI